MSWLGKLFKDYFQLGYVQPVSAQKLRSELENSSRGLEASWWYMGTDRYYHYLSERWGEHHREAWRIESSGVRFIGFSEFSPKAGTPEESGVLLNNENISFVQAT